MNAHKISANSKWLAFATLAITLLAIYPQINMWLARGKDWQGSYVLVQGDEIAYSAYINALIDGRPRRNDPHTGRDDAPGASQPESLFSIQFIPAYAIALPARAMGVTASTAFIVLMILSAIAASLSIFWLINSVTGDERLASAGVIFVLCLGTLVATQGEVRAFLGTAPTYSFFPFLRRYQPAVPFPLFFVFCTFVWRALNSRKQRTALAWAAAAGAVIAALIFSYFYLWTAAIAWLAGCVLVWCIWRREDRARTLWVSGIILAFAALTLVPYFRLLAHRDPGMDKVQLLTFTHAPDLFRVPEIIACVALAALLFGARRGLIRISSPALFVASLALMPLIVFNQQVVTGRSMQPLHYELFIANYVSLLALVMTVAVLGHQRSAANRGISGRAIAFVALLAFGWGVIEATGATKRDVGVAQVREDAMPVSKKLAELAKTDGSLNPAPNALDPRAIVFCSTLPAADALPTGSPQASLWALHMDAFPGASSAERQERFYQYMYYSGISDKDLEKAILEGRFAIMVALFGVERVIPGLAPGEKPLTIDELRSGWLGYTQYVAFFSRERAAHPTLSYVIVPTKEAPDLSNVDKWYERGPGQQAGLFTIYPVKLRA
jgi:hypothetical protein